MFTYSLQCLRPLLFTYLDYKTFASCFRVFRRALFALCVLYVI